MAESSPGDLEVARTLIQRGILAPDDLVQALREVANQPGRGLLDILVEMGALARRGGPAASATETPATPRGTSATSLAQPWKIGKFRALSHLGSGGMGSVFKAWQEDLRRYCAIKVVAAGRQTPLAGIRFMGDEARKSLFREARAAARLAHPNIVQIFEVGSHDGLDYIAMEYVPGLSLRELLALVWKGDALPPDRRGPYLRTLLHHMRDAILAVDYAHQAGVIHRDIKPGNILVLLETDASPEGGATLPAVRTLKVADFGLSLDLAAESASNFSDGMCGTPAYVAPERARGRASGFFPATDIFPLGVTLYEIVTGKNPFLRPTVGEILDAIRDWDPPPPDAGALGLPAGVGDVIQKCLEKQPFYRYFTAEAVAEALDDALRGISIEALAPSSAAREQSEILQALDGVPAKPAGLLKRLPSPRRRALVYYQRGRAREEAGDLHGALQDYNRVIATGKLAMRTHLRRGCIYHALGLVGDALEDWSWVAEHHPGVPEAHMNLGLGYRRLRRYPEALAALRRALEIAAPEWPHRATVERSLQKTQAQLGG